MAICQRGANVFDYRLMADLQTSSLNTAAGRSSLAVGLVASSPLALALALAIGCRA